MKHTQLGSSSIQQPNRSSFTHYAGPSSLSSNKSQPFKPSKKTNIQQKGQPQYAINQSSSQSKTNLYLQAYNQYSQLANQNLTPDHFHNLKKESTANLNDNNYSHDPYQRKKTIEPILHSQSTRVSPNRSSIAPHQHSVCAPPSHQSSINLNYRQSTARMDQSSHSQFNLRIPQQIQQQMRAPDGDDYSVESQSRVSQSFINHIYPSKSKKLINNENLVREDLTSQVPNQQNFVMQNPHHSKSKSLIVNDPNILPQKSSITQKVQHNNYKKQSSVFNYSQRLKQLLQETGEDQQIKYQQLFSQQPSPVQSKTNLLSSSNSQLTYPKQHSQFDPHPIQQMKPSIKSTFDKVNSHEPQQYLSLCDPSIHIPQSISQTIDIFQHQNMQKPHTSSNTPMNGNRGSCENSKQASQQKGGHIRKNSQPLKNNFVIDVSHSQSQYNQQALQQQQVQTRQEESRERSKKRDLSSEIRERIYEQHEVTSKSQNKYSQREKKHQPTQSKIIQNKYSNPSANVPSHKRSMSDYQGEYPQNPPPQKFKKYLNLASNSEFVQDSLTPTHNDFEQVHSIMAHNFSIGQNEDQQTISAQQDHWYRQTIKKHVLSQEKYQPAFNESLEASSFGQTTYHIPPTQQQQQHQYGQKEPKNHYHQRKGSMQQPNLSSLTAKRSPCKSSFVLKENYQRQSQQRKKQLKPSIYSQNQSVVQLQSQHYPLNNSSTQKQLNSHSQIIPPKIVQSEKVSPRKQIPAQSSVKMTLQKHHQHHQQKKNIVNVSIDLYKGMHHNGSVNVSSHYQPSIQQPALQYSQNQINKSQSKNVITRQSNSINNTILNSSNNQQQHQISSSQQNTNQPARSQQNSAIKRKDSFAQPMYKQQISNTRLSSPVRDDRSFQMLKPRTNCQTFIQNEKSLNQERDQSVQKLRKSQAVGQSLQNSPNRSSQLFQKYSNTKPQNSKLAQNSSNQHCQSVLILSPSNRCNSFANIQPCLNSKESQYQYSQRKEVELYPPTARHDHSHNQSIQDSCKAQMLPMKQIKHIQSNISKKVESIPTKKPSINYFGNENEHPQLSETERLLNQIRSNVIKQKSLPPQKLRSSEIVTDFEQFMNENPKAEDLCKITEASVEQNHLETNENLIYRKFQNPPKLQINEYSDCQNMYLTTDPNLSPYSKDLFKLKKIIKFNFKKFNEAPLTTSEFYRIGRVLGRGAFGKVNLASHKLSEQLVAIKSISKEFLKSEEDQKKKIMQEVAILKQSNHPSVVRLYDQFETSKHICFVMELCSGGDLLTYVRKRRKLKEDVAKYFFKQLIEGLAYLHHSKLIVHRDIKLDNILLDANGKIKICDFGVSKQAQTEKEIMTEQCGTPAYIAPEILRDKGYEGFKVDVWSAGVCLYAMLIGTVPFKAASMHELHNLIINGKYELKEQEGVSEMAKDLIAKLLTVDPKKRLSSYEVLSHPWMKDAEDEMDIFTQKEKDLIRKEYLSKNIERNCHKQIQQQQQDTDNLFTEHGLDTKTNNNSLLKNASTKSIILAPFNSTMSDMDDDESEANQKPYEWPSEVKNMIVNKKIIKFGAKCRDLDRQYEQNNNADLDNGVYNQFINEQEKEEEALLQNKDKVEEVKEKRGLEESSSEDSLKKSFRETELSSDDEKAEKQIEETHQKNLMQKSELVEFEKQIKLKYVKYQEPVHQIDQDVVEQVVSLGVYPQDYIIKTLNNKEMNYATASYNLLLKKRQILQKLISEQACSQ